MSLIDSSGVLLLFNNPLKNSTKELQLCVFTLMEGSLSLISWAKAGNILLVNFFCGFGVVIFNTEPKVNKAAYLTHG